MARQDVSKWVMIVCDVELHKILGTYSGFCVMRLDENKEWKNEAARFYEGDPISDYEDAIAYATSISGVVLKSYFIEDFWKRLGTKPGVKHGTRRN